MTTNEKFQAMRALLDDEMNASVRMTVDGDWYVKLPGLEIRKGGLLGGLSEFESNIVDAINAAWKRLTTLPAGQYIVIDAMKPSRRAYRWNGYAWKPFAEVTA